MKRLENSITNFLAERMFEFSPGEESSRVFNTSE